MKLQKGDILAFIGGGNKYSAKIGAKAIYNYTYQDCEGEEFINIKWIRDELSGSQEDGGYFESMFVKVFEKVEEVSTQKEDRILEENKKVMKFDLEKGKQGLVEYFNGDLDRATEYSLEYIKSCNDIDDIENEVYSFRAFKEEHKKVISRIERANTLSAVFEALEDTAIEDDDETILSFFIEELQ